MDEYVSRQDVITTIRENGVYGSGYSNEEREDNVVDMIESVPAADVRPVVMCRDCKHGQGAKMDFWNEYEGIECIGGVVHRKDWFCADGEKREN